LRDRCPRSCSGDPLARTFPLALLDLIAELWPEVEHLEERRSTLALAHAERRR
jgi:hypothetical protein